MDKIILVRHSESEWNASGVKEPNVKLTEYGKKLAESLNHEVELCICSPLRRCRETLDYSNIKYKNIIFTDLCIEYLDGNIVNYYNGDTVLYKESEQELEERINKFKEMLLELKEKYSTICVITHYCFLKKMTGWGFNNCFWMNYKL